LFVAVSNTGTANRVMTSPDGFNWTSRTTPQPGGADPNWTSVCWGAEIGKFIAVANGNNATNQRAMQSSDGITWSSVNTPTSGTAPTWTNVCWSPTFHRFVATANATSGGSFGFMYSDNGTSWNGLGGSSFYGKAVWSEPLGMFLIGGVNSSSNQIYRIAITENLPFGIGTLPNITTWYDILWIDELNQLIHTGVNGGTPVAYRSGRTS
jgi:hypothetical protein